MRVHMGECAGGRVWTPGGRGGARDSRVGPTPRNAYMAHRISHPRGFKMAKTIRIDYCPTKKQRMFHESCVDELLFGGAAGGGKTKAIVMDAMFRGLHYPGTAAYIFRRTFAELEGTVIKEALASIPRELGRYLASKHVMYFPNGSFIKFCHCAYEGDMYDYQGHEIDWLYFDELTHFTLPIYEYIKTRLRTKKESGVTPVVRCSANPGNVGHAWVKARFVDAGPYMSIVEDQIKDQNTGEVRINRRQYLPSLVSDNPYINDDYKFKLLQKPEALRRALLNGDWDVFEGQAFIEFTDDPTHYDDGIKTHVIKPFEIPTHWPRYMSFDWGSARPFSVGWWAVAPSGTVYRYREWYGWNGTPNVGLNKTVSEIATEIIDIETRAGERGLFIDRVCDPALMFERERGDSLAQKFSDHGLHFRRGDNSRMAAKAELHERFRFREDGKPAMYVFSNCKQFIRTVPALPYSLSKPEDIDTDAEDHIYDETRYFLMCRPMIPKDRGAGAEIHYNPF